MKIAPAISKNRMSHFAKSHLRFLKIAHAIFGPCRRGIGYWIFPRVPPWLLLILRISICYPHTDLTNLTKGASLRPRLSALPSVFSRMANASVTMRSL